MSSAGRAANSTGCVSKPKEHATGLIGFAAQIRRSSLISSCAMETAEHREPCESRGSRTVLGAPGGEIPPGDSTLAAAMTEASRGSFRAVGHSSRASRKMARQSLTHTLCGRQLSHCNGFLDHLICYSEEMGRRR